MGKEDLLAEYQKVRVPDIYDALLHMNFRDITVMDDAIKPIRSGYDVRGSALTVRWLPTNKPMPFIEIKDYNKLKFVSAYIDQVDWSWEYQGRAMFDIMDKITPGDIIVNEMGGIQVDHYGSHQALKYQLKGAVGFVIDGGVRDSYELRQYPQAIFARYATHRSHMYRIELQSINEPINCGGARVELGDIICGDDDGVVVVPKKYAEEVLELGRRSMERDDAMKKEKLGLLGLRIDYTRPVKTAPFKNLNPTDWKKIVDERH